MTQSKRVVVIMGGISSEREVSLVSGAAITKALREAGFDAVPFDLGHDIAALIAALAPPPDAVFNALHGRFGEDGTLQGLLELLGIPYTHSGVLASAIAMDKPMTKRLVETVGIRTPKGRVVPRADLGRGDPMPAPYVIKPVAEGSTVGVHIVRKGENMPPLADERSLGESVLVEEYIKGRELTVGIMGDRALGVTEIRFQGGIFDYTAKYTAGHAQHILPADVPAVVYDAAMQAALLAHRTLGCRGISRSDFRYDDTQPGDTGLYFLELNNQPGFTPVSLVPEQAQRAGISFGELVTWLVDNATCERRT
ncbi:MAG TPA: D-alanine--D-alanine ligase [Alphaproteobacteria bacterium]|nr:D-alanine--D-alanine ligase [Alphaproteobacteria bacterium]